MANSITLRVTTERFQEFRVFVAREYAAGSWRWHLTRLADLDGVAGPCRASSAKHTSRNAALAAAMAELLDWAEES